MKHTQTPGTLKCCAGNFIDLNLHYGGEASDGKGSLYKNLVY